MVLDDDVFEVCTSLKITGDILRQDHNAGRICEDDRS